jgi:hypothetical protein
LIIIKLARLFIPRKRKRKSRGGGGGWCEVGDKIKGKINGKEGQISPNGELLFLKLRTIY